MQQPTENPRAPLLSVRGLSVSFWMYDNAFHRRQTRAITDLCLTVEQGEILAIAGSSGSGKSLLAHAVLGLLPANAAVTGTMRYRGSKLTPALQKQLRGSEMALVPQSVTFLDPTMRVGRQVGGEVGARHAVFERYGLAPKTDRLYPHELSGGMARRVLAATAALSQAPLLIADEPTPGLSPAQALALLHTFREFADSGRGVALITHDIDLALQMADRIAVFYAGTTVEIAPAADFSGEGDALRHPYSRALYRALPQNGFEPLAGTQPDSAPPQAGCLFAPRCAQRTAHCTAATIPMQPLRGGMVRCCHAT